MPELSVNLAGVEIVSNQKIIKVVFQASTLCASIAILTISSGCSMLPMAQDKSLPTMVDQKEASGFYEVQMKGKLGRISTARGAIDGPITVQTVLERSGAIEKFRAMEITLLRVVKDSGRGLKLPVEYEASKDAVRPEQDYAIHPGDQIMIEAKTGSAIDKIVDSVVRQ